MCSAMSCANSDTLARASTSNAVRARVYESAPMSTAVTLTSMTPNSTMRVAMNPRPSRSGVRGGRRGRSSAIVRVAAALLLAASTTTIPVRACASSSGMARFIPTRDPSGEGYLIRDLGLWFAGDLTAVGSVPENRRPSLELDDIDVLARYEPSPRLSFFTELRLEETFVSRAASSSTSAAAISRSSGCTPTSRSPRT